MQNQGNYKITFDTVEKRSNIMAKLTNDSLQLRHGFKDDFRSGCRNVSVMNNNSYLVLEL